MLLAIWLTALLAADQRRAEERLRRSEARYREMADNASYGIYQSNLEGDLWYVNRALVEMLGYGSSEELLEKRLPTDIYCDPQARQMLLEEALQTGRVTGKEAEWRKKDGSQMHVRLSGRVVRQGQSVRGLEVLVENISERRLLEQQLRQSQKMQAVGQLAGGVAHDFNNLLGVILGHAELLETRLPAADPARRSVGQVKKAGEQAASLTRQLLAFSRQQVLQPRVLNLNSVVASMQEMLRRLIGEHIELTTVLHPALGPIRADPNQMEQVVLNLAVNAREAMPQGGKLTIETENVQLDAEYARQHVAVAPGPFVVLTFSDTGVGMDAATQARIFEPFFTTKPQGSGLGLATVYGIVKQSDGNIWVYSELGWGSTFKVYLPRVDEAVPAEAARPPKASSLRGHETILLFEDAAPLRAIIRESLEQSGYRVLEAASGPEALRLAEEHDGPLHLLLTDVIMPGMNGREVAQGLCALRPNIKVLYMSGYTDAAIANHGVLHAGTLLIIKPFSREALGSKVRETLAAPPENSKP